MPIPQKKINTYQKMFLDMVKESPDLLDDPELKSVMFKRPEVFAELVNTAQKNHARRYGISRDTDNRSIKDIKEAANKDARIRYANAKKFLENPEGWNTNERRDALLRAVRISSNNRYVNPDMIDELKEIYPILEQKVTDIDTAEKLEEDLLVQDGGSKQKRRKKSRKSRRNTLKKRPRKTLKKRPIKTLKKRSKRSKRSTKRR